MAVLNTTSPTLLPVAPMAMPRNTVPSAKTRMAGFDCGTGDSHDRHKEAERTCVFIPLLIAANYSGLAGGVQCGKARWCVRFKDAKSNLGHAKNPNFVAIRCYSQKITPYIPVLNLSKDPVYAASQFCARALSRLEF